MNTEQEIAKLKQQVAELIEWKTQRERQLITYPLDERSLAALNKYFPKWVKNITYTGPSGFELEVETLFELDKRPIPVLSGPIYYSYIPDSSTDTLRTNQAVQNDWRIDFFSTQTVPTGLTAGPYYIVNKSGNTFQVSTTVGGAAVNFTSNGAGDHYFFYA